MIDASLTKFPKVTVILRGYNYEQVRCVVRSMVGTKLGAIEVAMNTPGAAQIIEKVVNEFGDEVLVGAGTVISATRANAAVEAGARFALSPICFTEEIFSICKANGLLTVPSAFSPSEVWSMFEMGADIVVSHHPHVPMNYETVGEKVIFYSLGNFVFDTDYQRSQYHTEDGLFVKLRFSEEGFRFEPFPIRIDRAAEQIVKGELPLIFRDVNASEYEKLL